MSNQPSPHLLDLFRGGVRHMVVSGPDQCGKTSLIRALLKISGMDGDDQCIWWNESEGSSLLDIFTAAVLMQKQTSQEQQVNPEERLSKETPNGGQTEILPAASVDEEEEALPEIMQEAPFNIIEPIRQTHHSNNFYFEDLFNHLRNDVMSSVREVPFSNGEPINHVWAPLHLDLQYLADPRDIVATINSLRLDGSSSLDIGAERKVVHTERKVDNLDSHSSSTSPVVIVLTQLPQNPVNLNALWDTFFETSHKVSLIVECSDIQFSELTSHQKKRFYYKFEHTQKLISNPEEEKSHNFRLNGKQLTVWNGNWTNSILTNPSEPTSDTEIDQSAWVLLRDFMCRMTPLIFLDRETSKINSDYGAFFERRKKFVLTMNSLERLGWICEPQYQHLTFSQPAEGVFCWNQTTHEHCCLPSIGERIQHIWHSYVENGLKNTKFPFAHDSLTPLSLNLCKLRKYLLPAFLGPTTATDPEKQQQHTYSPFFCWIHVPWLGFGLYLYVDVFRNDQQCLDGSDIKTGFQTFLAIAECSPAYNSDIDSQKLGRLEQWIIANFAKQAYDQQQLQQHTSNDLHLQMESEDSLP